MKRNSSSSLKDSPSDSSSSQTAASLNAGSVEPPLKTSSSLPKTTTNVYLGYFQSSSIYLKLYETTKISFNSYKKSPSIGVYDRFLQTVKATLKLFSQLLEAGLGVYEIGPHLDEILLYLKVIFTVDPSSSVKCVTLSLKALFNLNLSGLMFEYIQQQLNAATTNQLSSPTLPPKHQFGESNKSDKL